MYSLVHISSDEVFYKILKKPSIDSAEKMIPHMKAKVLFIGKYTKKFFEKKIKMAD